MPAAAAPRSLLERLARPGWTANVQIPAGAKLRRKKWVQPVSVPVRFRYSILSLVIYDLRKGSVVVYPGFTRLNTQLGSGMQDANHAASSGAHVNSVQMVVELSSAAPVGGVTNVLHTRVATLLHFCSIHTVSSQFREPNPE
ncbi:hypothetical protein B0H14DRAFT_2597604 [Mycena olivaceomarginata]|nr:hypothetical protein B0H14DRAFT_2597604 [Mycena olivaceomarginata]